MSNLESEHGNYSSSLLNNEVFLLTIITINWNNALGLARTLKSLSSLSKEVQIQFIFIDGGSNDDSVKLAENFYASENFVSEPDRGIYHAMNKGLALAKGKYVLWLNSGDELLPDVIHDIKKELHSSHASVVAFGVNRIPEDPAKEIFKNFSDLSDLPGQTFPHQATFFHRQSLLAIGGYSERYKIAADREALLKLFFLRKEIVTIPKIISNFYAGGISSSEAVSFDNLSIDRRFNLLSKFEYCKRIYSMKGWRGFKIIAREFFPRHKNYFNI